MHYCSLNEGKGPGNRVFINVHKTSTLGQSWTNSWELWWFSKQQVYTLCWFYVSSEVSSMCLVMWLHLINSLHFVCRKMQSLAQNPMQRYMWYLQFPECLMDFTCTSRLFVYTPVARNLSDQALMVLLCDASPPYTSTYFLRITVKNFMY
jgi:hypothetical protein